MKKLIAMILLGLMLLGMACTPKKDQNANQGQNNQPRNPLQRQNADDVLND
jgi:hypothetical protein